MARSGSRSLPVARRLAVVELLPQRVILVHDLIEQILKGLELAGVPIATADQAADKLVVFVAHVVVSVENLVDDLSGGKACIVDTHPDSEFHEVDEVIWMEVGVSYRHFDRL